MKLIILKITASIIMLFSTETYATLSIDLTEMGRPFHRFVTQDQDGIGVCYANAASAILQGVMEDAEDVSYFDLAIQYKESTFLGSSLDTALNQGYICKTINAAKEGNGVCTREDVLLENLTIEGDRQNISRKLLEKANGVYQSLDRLSPENKEYFINQLEEFYEEKFNSSLNMCRNIQDERSKNLSIYSSLAALADKVKRKIKELKNSRLPGYKDQIKILKNSQRILKNKLKYKPPLNITRDKYEVSRNNKLEEIIRSTYRPFVSKFTENDVSKVDSFENTFFSHLGLSSFPDLYRGTITPKRLHFDRSMIKSDECAKTEALNILSNYGLSNQGMGEIIRECNFEFQLNRTAEYLAFITRHLPLFTDQNIFEMLRSSGDRSDFLRQATRTQCAGNRIPIPDNLNCTPYNAHTQFHIKNRPQDEIINEMRARIEDQLGENRPIGIGVCSLFMRERGVNSEFGADDKCTGGGMNQFHAMTIVGARDVRKDTGGETRQYLIQNSWGEDCGYHPTAENCIGDTGRFWVNEEELLINTRSISEISFN